MRIIILCVICSVVPTFFAFVFLHGTRNRLAVLRERCRTAPDPARAVADYDAARKAFPTSLVAGWFGFGPVDSLLEKLAQKNPSNAARSS